MEPKPYELKWTKPPRCWKEWVRLAVLGGSGINAYVCPVCHALVVVQPDEDVRALHELWHYRCGSL